MFWITFVVTGLTVASIPWIARQFSNEIAGLILLFPVMFTFGIIAQFLAHGEQATVDMIKASFVGFPAIILFLGLCILLFQRHISLPIVLGASLLIWLVAAYTVNTILTK